MLFGAIAVPLAVNTSKAKAVLGNQGLQGGWVISNNGDVNFPHSLQNQLPLIQEAGAGWIRIGFRLGGVL